VLSCIVLINSVLYWAARVNGGASLVAAPAASPANRCCAVLGAFPTHSPAVITARGISTKKIYFALGFAAPGGLTSGSAMHF